MLKQLSISHHLASQLGGLGGGQVSPSLPTLLLTLFSSPTWPPAHTLYSASASDTLTSRKQQRSKEMQAEKQA